MDKTDLIAHFRFVALGAVLLFSAPAEPQSVYTPGIVPPELVGDKWLNTPKNEPIKLASRKGKVTILEYWTFG